MSDELKSLIYYLEGVKGSRFRIVKAEQLEPGKWNLTVEKYESEDAKEADDDNNK